MRAMNIFDLCGLVGRLTARLFFFIGGLFGLSGLGFWVVRDNRTDCSLGQSARRTRACFRLASHSSSANRCVFLAGPR